VGCMGTALSHLNVVLMFDMDFLTKLYIYQSF
jgi:hypothetical protein